MQRIKFLVKQLSPPVATNIYRKIRLSNSKKTIEINQPAWHIINSGILKGRRIYVNIDMPAYREMVEGNHDSFLWDFLNNVDLKEKVVIDVGSHIGYHSFAFSKLVGSNGKVIAFEPNHSNIERMNLIINKNDGFDNNRPVAR